MELPVNVSEPLLVNVRVDLGRSNIGMAEELLDDSQVGSILQKMSGKGVSEEVRVDFLGDARLPRSFLDDLPDTIRSQWPTPDGKKNLGGAVWFKEAGALVAEVALQRVAGPASTGNDPGFVSFARDPQESVVEIEGLQSDGADFGEAQPGRIKQFKDRQVPATKRLGSVNGIQDLN